jgi:hypothetical protein
MLLKAAVRVGLKVRGRTMDTFNDLKASWQMNGDQPNVAKFYATCHGDYEGKRNQLWSQEMELRHMLEQNIVCDTEPKLREKGIMSKSNKTHRGRIVLSLKNDKELPDRVQNFN